MLKVCCPSSARKLRRKCLRRTRATAAVNILRCTTEPEVRTSRRSGKRRMLERKIQQEHLFSQPPTRVMMTITITRRRCRATPPPTEDHISKPAVTFLRDTSSLTTVGVEVEREGEPSMRDLINLVSAHYESNLKSLILNMLQHQPAIHYFSNCHFIMELFRLNLKLT